MSSVWRSALLWISSFFLAIISVSCWTACLLMGNYQFSHMKGLQNTILENGGALFYTECTQVWWSIFTLLSIGLSCFSQSIKHKNNQSVQYMRFVSASMIPHWFEHYLGLFYGFHYMVYCFLKGPLGSLLWNLFPLEQNYFLPKYGIIQSLSRIFNVLLILYDALFQK